MKVSDHTMTILTGLVLTVAVGTLAQNSESIMGAFTGGNRLIAADDAYTVRAGRSQLLDVLLNDSIGDEIRENAIQIVRSPSCGTLRTTNGQVEFIDSETCAGRITFAYCLTEAEDCASATVALNIRPSAAPGTEIAALVESETEIAAPVAGQTEIAAPVEGETEVAVNGEPAVADTAVVAAPELAVPVAVLEVDPQVATAGFQGLNTAVAQPISVPDANAPTQLIAPDLAVAELSPVLQQAQNQSFSQNDGTLDDLQAGFPQINGPETPQPLSVAGTDMAPVIGAPIGEGLTVAVAEITLPAPEPAPVDAACITNLVVSPAPGGEYRVQLTAPCQPATEILVSNGSFVFAASTDESGAFAGTFPALGLVSNIAVLLPDGVRKDVVVEVPDASKFTRVAVLWTGAVDLDLHASEYGAVQGQPGHVWSGEPGSYRQSRQNGGGYLQSFSNGADFAEIYSLPVSKRQSKGLVDLSLRVADGSTVCDQPVDLRVLRFEGGTSRATNVKFTLASCGDSANGYEILNALGDLRVAAR